MYLFIRMTTNPCKDLVLIVLHQFPPVSLLATMGVTTGVTAQTMGVRTSTTRATGMMVLTMGATTSHEVTTLLLSDVRIDLADGCRPDLLLGFLGESAA